MKIAQVAPLDESTPPKTYGGIERIVACLTDELTGQGHEVTLFATADSTANAHRLIPGSETGLRTSVGSREAVARHREMLQVVARMADEFDIIHIHLDRVHMPMARANRWRHITTMHGRLDQPEHLAVYRDFKELPVVSISNAQRRPVPEMNWQSTIYNGLPLDARSHGSGDGGYLAFVGRVSPDKGLDRAIHIARRAGIPLRIAAKIDEEQQDYFRECIEPLLHEPDVEFMGEISGAEKKVLLGKACALLFPIDWPEPFGLVMIEAMACGTPVIAYRHGAVPEVIRHGVTGFVVETVAEAVAAVDKLDQIDRRACMAQFEERFSAGRMAREYVRVYARLAAGASEWNQTQPIG